MANNTHNVQGDAGDWYDVHYPLVETGGEGSLVYVPQLWQRGFPRILGDIPEEPSAFAYAGRFAIEEAILHELFDQGFVQDCLAYGSDTFLVPMTDLESGQPVVMKCFRYYMGPCKETDVHPMERFQMERFFTSANLYMGLQHPGIPKAYGMSVLQGLHGEIVPFLVMEQVPGNMLSTCIGQVNREEALEVLTQLADILDYVHSQGLVHMDLKPENILVDRSEGKFTLHLVDFGDVTRIGQELTCWDGGGGIYHAPEVTNHNSNLIGAHSDLYSLAMIGRTLLGGAEGIANHYPQLLPIFADALGDIHTRRKAFPAPACNSFAAKLRRALEQRR